MPYSDQQIAGILGFFQQKRDNTAAAKADMRRAVVADTTYQNMDAKPRVRPGAYSKTVGNYSPGAVRPIDEDTRTFSAADRAARAKNPEMAVTNDGTEAGSSTSDLLNAAGGGTLGGNLFEERDAAEAPKNFTQWLVDALGTGTNVTARAGEALIKGGQRARAQADKGDWGGAIGTGLKAVTLDQAGGAARGLTEGLGARYDGERARTWGQNLEDVGTERALKGALGEQAGGIAQGTLGFVADVGLDPTTYLTLGLTGVARGVAGGAQLARAEGRSVAAGAARGAFEGAAARRAEIAAQAAQARAARQARKNPTGPVSTGAEQMARDAAARQGDQAMPAPDPATRRPDVPAAAVPDAAVVTAADDLATPALAPEPAPEPVRVPEVPAQAAPELPAGPAEALGRQMEAAVPERVELPAGAVDDAVPGAARAEEAPAGPVVDPKDAAARAATDELLPQIEGRSPDVDPDAVLAQAAGARAIPEDTATGIMDAATALRGGGHTVASWEKSIKELTKGKANAEFFGRTVKYRGQEMTLRDALRDAGIGALTGSARGFGPLDSMLKVINGAATPKISPDSIGAALEKAQPGLTAQLDLADIMQKLVGADEAGRKAVLQEAIGARTGEKYESFDKAIAGAVDGKIEASMMRSMLRALGINTRATTPHGMRKVLAEKGLTRWEELQNSIMTAAESVDRHGLPDDAVEAAKEVDAPAALEAMTIHYQTKVEELGFDPAVMAPMKEGGTVVGEAVHDAIQAFGRRVKGAEMSEAYDNTMMQDLWGATMRSAARYANQNRMSGARRGDWLYERVLKAVDLTEDYARSVGSMPRIATRDAEVPDPVFVSLGQILRAADPAAVKAALFSPDMAPIAREGAKITRYNYGISLYPTAMGDAVHHAVKAVKTGRLGPEVEAELVDLLTAKHRGTKNTWAQSSAGVAAIKQWAAAVADPGFLRHMVQLDGDQGPVAVAIAQQAAEGIITPMTERIIKALNENADRGAIQTVIDKAREEAVAVTRGVDGKATFLADEVLRRLDNGFLNGVLGREGAKIVKGDKRMERTVAPKGQPEPAVTRGEVAAAKRETGADYVDDVAEDVELAAERGDIAPDDTAKLELYMAMLAEKTGAGQLFDRIGVAVSGRYGMPDAKPVALIVEGRTRAASAEYAEAISRWIHGGRQRLAGAGMPGLRERLAAELGVPKVDYATISSKLRQWWHALAQADGTLTGDELRAALVKGSDGVNPLSEGEAQMASEFKALIDRVFDESSSGPFVRSGIETADLVRTLRSHGFEDGTPLGALTPDAGESLAWQSGTWRDFELTEDVDPLDVLQGYFGALSASSVRPSVGAEMSLHFDHRAAGLTPAQARAEGWMKIDTLDARGDGLARYLDPDSYFPPEIRKQMTYLENFLQSSRSFGNSGIRGQIISTYKTILHVLKSSATIWRPGHHVASVLGEVSMLVMAGVNPLQSLRSFGVLRAAGQMLDADMSVLGKMDSLANGRALDPRFANIADGRGVQLTVNGQQVQLTNAEIWTAALRHEVAMTHTATRDIVDAPSVRFEKSEWRNPFAAVDTRLGQFSATRDNVTRIGHFIDALEKGTYRSLDEAYRRAASKVHDYHPTMGTLSAFEQKYARLAFYFYTWVKQAASRVIRTALDQPGLFMLPFKAQYNAAEAAGFDPASFGQPMPTNPDVLDEAYGEDGYPDYYQTGLLGPTFQAGDSPIDGGEGNLWGFSLSTPQIDTLTTAFKGIDTDPEDPLGGVYGAIGAPLGMLAGAASPVISVPLQLGGVDMTGFGAPEGSREVNEMLLRSTGAPGALAGALPGYNDVFDPVAPPAARKSLEAQARENAGYEAEQAEADGDDVRRLLNYLTGTKVTNYSKG